MSNRTYLYLQIAKRSLSEEGEAQAKDFADRFHNELVAISLALPLHTLHGTSLPPATNSLGREASDVFLIDPAAVGDLTTLSFCWRDIEAIERAFPQRPGRANVEVALEELSQRYGRRPIVVPKLGEGAVEGVLAVALEQAKLIAFSGAFGTALLSILMAALSAVAGNRIGLAVQSRRVERAEKVLKGWGPRLTRP
jgi:hypothetical protein